MLFHPPCRAEYSIEDAKNSVKELAGEIDTRAARIKAWGKSVVYAKVIIRIDDMVTLLKTEQADDDKKKEYCTAEADKLDDQKKALERKISDTETAIEKTPLYKYM